MESLVRGSNSTLSHMRTPQVKNDTYFSRFFRFKVKVHCHKKMLTAQLYPNKTKEKAKHRDFGKDESVIKPINHNRKDITEPQQKSLKLQKPQRQTIETQTTYCFLPNKKAPRLPGTKSTSIFLKFASLLNLLLLFLTLLKQPFYHHRKGCFW